MIQVYDNANRSADVAAIQDLLGRLVRYWNNGDGLGYGTCFTEDADYIDVTGTHTRGGDAIGKAHQFLFNGPLKGSQLEGYRQVEQSLTFLAPTVALLISGGVSRLEGQAEAPADRQSVNTTVFIKRDGEWLIRAFQNNRVMSLPFPPNAAGAPHKA